MSQLPIRIRILAPKVPLYPSEHAGEVPICFLTDSDEGEIIPASNGFVRFKHLDNRTGFIRGDVQMFRIQYRTVNLPNIPLYREATSKSPVVYVVRHAELRIRGVVIDKKGRKWADVVTDRGRAGFLPDYALGLTPTDKQHRENRGLYFMIRGAIYFGIGVFGIVGSLYSRGRNGVFLVFCAGIIFGAIRFVIGLRICLQLRRSAPKRQLEVKSKSASEHFPPSEKTTCPPSASP